MKKFFALLTAIGGLSFFSHAQSQDQLHNSFGGRSPAIEQMQKEIMPHKFGLGLDYTFPRDPKLTTRLGFCKHWYVENRFGYEFFTSGYDAQSDYRALYSDLELYYSYWHRDCIELFAGAGLNWEHIFAFDGYEKSDAYLNVTLIGIEWRPVKEIPNLAFGADGIYKQGPGDRPGTYFRINVLCYLL